MTEDDTFRVLSRPSVLEVAAMVLTHNNSRTTPAGLVEIWSRTDPERYVSMKLAWEFNNIGWSFKELILEAKRIHNV